MEEWRPIAGFPTYEVSDQGRVRSWVGRLGRRRSVPLIMKHALGATGYHFVILWAKGKKKSHYVHRLVLLTFLGEPAVKTYEVAHLDGTPSNNRLINLMWASKKENHSHKIKHGTTNRGERSYTAKLTTDQVINIRERYVPGCKVNGQSAMAREYGMSKTEVRDILLYNRWIHLAYPHGAKDLLDALL